MIVQSSFKDHVTCFRQASEVQRLSRRTIKRQLQHEVMLRRQLMTNRRRGRANMKMLRQSLLSGHKIVLSTSITLVPWDQN
jgi:hypothetical protein